MMTMISPSKFSIPIAAVSLSAGQFSWIAIFVGLFIAGRTYGRNVRGEQ